MMKTVVHLEDDSPLRDILRIALEYGDPSLEIQQFGGSDEAINYIRAHVDEIALYILDIRVPGVLNGLGVAEQIRRFGSERPIILCSAYSRPDPVMMQTLGCMWMSKPVHVRDVQTKILPYSRLAID